MTGTAHSCKRDRARLTAIAHAATACCVAALAIAVSACASHPQRLYTGTELAESEVVHLTGANESMIFLLYNRVHRTWILSIDGQQVDPGVNAWQLSPGTHRIVTRSVDHHIFYGGHVGHDTPARAYEFTGAAGHRYVAKGHMVRVTPDYAEYCPWTEDVETGAIVGGSQSAAAHAD